MFERDDRRTYDFMTNCLHNIGKLTSWKPGHRQRLEKAALGCEFYAKQLGCDSLIKSIIVIKN